MRGGFSRRARALRRDMTPPERRLWGFLRGEALGVRFRRQHPVPPFVLDFACLELRLAVEVDGGTHGADAARAADAARDAVLTRMGWRVVRFAAAEVMREAEGVVTRIMAEIQEGRGPEVG